MTDVFATPGPLSTFPAPGLRDIQRNITTHDESGAGVFLKPDNGDHHTVMANGRAISNILYNQSGLPINLNDDVDVKYARANEVRLPRHPHLPRPIPPLSDSFASPGSWKKTARWCG